ncbi:hypothetical protein A0H81_13731 [Grifola frondosa]|uniref:Uncharacterized protein n=1 Tax=Grifola frondosa TaxID=5627 RepID=A0A1C7LTL1_GRIFR|nr:hypothetical protein A0H81_13731 [Grifola frondosa]
MTVPSRPVLLSVLHPRATRNSYAICAGVHHTRSTPRPPWMWPNTCNFGRTRQVACRSAKQPLPPESRTASRGAGEAKAASWLPAMNILLGQVPCMYENVARGRRGSERWAL